MLAELVTHSQPLAGVSLIAGRMRPDEVRWASLRPLWGVRLAAYEHGDKHYRRPR